MNYHKCYTYNGLRKSDLHILLSYIIYLNMSFESTCQFHQSILHDPNRITSMKEVFSSEYLYIEIPLYSGLMLFTFLSGISVREVYNYKDEHKLKRDKIFSMIVILILLLWIGLVFYSLKCKTEYKKRMEDIIKYEEIKDDYYKIIDSKV